MQRTPQLHLSPSAGGRADDPAPGDPPPAHEPAPDRGGVPRHVAVIMDGNGRWATARGRPRTVGHVAGVRAVRRTVDAACVAGIDVLTLYAFSGDNWRRPRDEVGALMHLFRRYLAGETARCVAHGVRLAIVGRRDRLDPALRRAIDAAEDATAGGTRLHLRIAVDYSARDTIARAAQLARDEAVAAVLRAIAEGAHADRCGTSSRDLPDAARRDAPAPLHLTLGLPPHAPLDPARFATLLAHAMHDDAPAPPVDLLVRTGGERRLSDFLLWECAYAELWFTPTMWPDFDAAELSRALADFAARERRFGALPPRAAAATRAALTPRP